ncbi:hypothetical protein TNCV_3159821 [Trichonephila clavipes]|nr:hypothetical protein TNCV_3159821 [Trichonephila clavipes]
MRCAAVFTLRFVDIVRCSSFPILMLIFFCPVGDVWVPDAQNLHFSLCPDSLTCYQRLFSLDLGSSSHDIEDPASRAAVAKPFDLTDQSIHNLNPADH